MTGLVAKSKRFFRPNSLCGAQFRKFSEKQRLCMNFLVRSEFTRTPASAASCKLVFT